MLQLFIYVINAAPFIPNIFGVRTNEWWKNFSYYWDEEFNSTIFNATILF